MKYLLCLCFTLFPAVILRAQCPGCVPIDCSAQNPDGGLCDTLITGMANHPLDEQVSFYMPSVVYNTQAPGNYVRLRRIKVTGVTGLPLGLNWETNHSPGNEYFPQTGDSIGCVRICGTPLQAGVYPLTVYLLADVTVISLGLDVNNQAQTYNTAVVHILADTSGGVSSFTVTPEIYSSCEPLTLTFEAQLTSPTNPVSYEWDFGNGVTATGMTPPAQTFSDAGQYPVTLNTTIREFVIRSVRIIQVNGNWTGDIEELTSFLNSPDLYFTIPALGYTSSEKTNASTPATWSNLSIHVPIGTSQIELRIYDKDNGPPLGSQDDSLGSAIINVAAGSPQWTDRWGTITNGDIIMNDTTGSVFTETLNITIGEKPAGVLIATTDSICQGDSALLQMSGSNFGQLSWFKDSVFIPGAFDTLYTATEAGTYWVDLVSPSGCAATTAPVNVSVFAIPRVPVFYFNATTQLIYTTNHAGVAHIQWYKDGEPITGATSSQYTVADTGYYKVEYANEIGCSTASSQMHITSLTTAAEAGAVTFDMELFPNPSTGMAHLRFTRMPAENMHLVVNDELGRAILTHDFLIGADDFPLDLSALPPGNYFIRITSNKGHCAKKIILSH